MRRLLLLLLFAPVAFAQDGAVPSIETDKTEYAYGETIEVRYTITNRGKEPFTLIGASFGCQAQILFDDFDSKFADGACSADDFPYVFEPGQSRVWMWQLTPRETGLPQSSGEHKVTGYYGYRHESDYLAATTTVTAPEFVGGPIEFGLAEGFSLDDIQDVLDALNAIEADDPSWRCGPFWTIEGTTPEEAIAEYKEDPRFTYFESHPCVTYSEAFFTTDADEAAPLGSPVLTAANPNPFTTSTSFALSIPTSGSARVEVFDLLGRRVATLHDGPLAAAEHHFTFHARTLPAGLYLVRASGAGFTQTRRITLTR